jgi:hypothetical protein
MAASTTNQTVSQGPVHLLLTSYRGSSKRLNNLLQDIVGGFYSIAYRFPTFSPLRLAEL